MPQLPTVTHQSSGTLPKRRRGIPASVKSAVISRDGLACYHCGLPVVRKSQGYQPDVLHFDHLIPWAAGGADTAENIVVSCGHCNLRRPKPVRATRRRHVSFRRKGDDFYWTTPGYCPPKRMSHNSPRGFAIIDASEIMLGVEPVEILSRICSGVLPGTQGVKRPIRVDLLGHLSRDFIRQRLIALEFDELGFYA